jgi:DAPG hydrolase PhiG domain
VQLLEDGRLHCFIRHDVLHGVTPSMLAWWFDHIDGDVEIEGVRHPRYRVWHPRDHVAHSYLRRGPRGGGPGSLFRIHEVLARNPSWEIDVRTEVTQLDESGFAHRPRPHGWPRLNAALLRLGFPLEKARAWLRHNIEEVGNFEFFLPALYAAETGRRT